MPTAAGSSSIPDLPGLTSRFGAATPLGSGVSKRVYVAVDRVLGREVAIAQIDLSTLSSAQLDCIDEAKVIARVSDHRYISTIHDVIEYRNFVYFVMQYFRGGDLRTALANRPCADVSKLLEWAGQLLDALSYAHRQGIIHRDVKPDNVFLDEHGQAHLGDFGLATHASSFQGHDVVGTPEYMAPEQIRGDQVDGRTDLYSLGCTLYCLASGRVPFEGPLEEVLHGQLERSAEPLSSYRSDLPSGFVELVHRLMTKAPDERPQSAQRAMEMNEAAIRELRLAAKYNIATRVSRNDDDTVNAGDYLFLQTLEKSAEATVSLARHAADGREVILKLYAPLTQRALQGFERNVERLRGCNHPGVAPIVDSGRIGERAWYAIEPSPGVTMQAYLQSRPPLTEVAALFMNIASALSALHARGIVHGELNGGNVIVNPGEAPVLVGYRLVPSTAPDEDGDIAGANQCTPPERILGERLDARADLYSLGCLLYEAVTGQPLFEGDRTVDFASAHLETAVRSPRELVPSLPRTMDDLILGLLEKSPVRRIGNAFEVFDVLQSTFPGASTKLQLIRQRNIFEARPVGRIRTLTELHERLVCGLQGQAQYAIVLGEPGIGKSTLLREATRTGPKILRRVLCTAMPHAGQNVTRALDALLPLIRMISEVCRQSDVDPSVLLGEHGRVLAEYDPSLALLDAVRQHPMPLEVTGVAAENRIVNALVDVVERLVRIKPLLIIVDDVHWADALSLRVLTSLASGIEAGSPLIVLATARSEENADRLAPLYEAGYQALEIGGLDADAVSEMLSDMLAYQTLPRTLTDHVAGIAMGNPLIVTELVQAMIESDVLDPNHPESFDPAGLSSTSSIDAIVAGRVMRLNADQRFCLEALAVMAEDIDDALLAAVLSGDVADPKAAVGELLKRRLIVESEPGRYRFSHRSIADAVYRQISPERVRVLHERCAESLSGRSNVSVSQLSRLAQHHVHAGNVEAAFYTSSRAAELAFTLADYDAAARYLTTAVKLYEDPRVRSRLALEAWDLVKLETLRYHVESRRGNPAISILHARRALARAGVDLPERPAGWWVLIVREALGELLRSLFGEMTLEDTNALRIMRERVAPAVGLSQMYYNQDDLVAAIALNLLIVRTARRIGEPEVALGSYYVVATLWDLVGLHGLAQKYEKHAEEALGNAGGDLGARINALIVKSTYWIHKGNVAEAGAAALEACGYRTAYPDPYWLETVWIARSNAEFYQGRYAESLESAEEVLASAQARGSAPYVCWGQMLRARVFEVRGESERAAEALADGRRHFDQQTEQIHRLGYSGIQALSALETDGLDAARVVVEETLGELNGISDGHLNLLEGYRGALETQMRIVETQGSRRDVQRFKITLKSLRRFCRITRLGVPTLLFYQGRLYKAVAKEKDALRYYQKAAELAERWRLPREAALAHGACADLALLGETERRDHVAAATRWREQTDA